jgi:hypothetical protein
MGFWYLHLKSHTQNHAPDIHTSSHHTRWWWPSHSWWAHWTCTTNWHTWWHNYHTNNILIFIYNTYQLVLWNLRYGGGFILVFHVTISRHLLTHYQEPSVYVKCYIKKIIIKMLVCPSLFKNKAGYLGRNKKRQYTYNITELCSRDYCCHG